MDDISLMVMNVFDAVFGLVSGIFPNKRVYGRHIYDLQEDWKFRTIFVDAIVVARW